MQLNNRAERRDAPELELIDEAREEQKELIAGVKGRSSFWWWAMLTIAALAGVTAVMVFVGHHQLLLGR